MPRPHPPEPAHERAALPWVATKSAFFWLFSATTCLAASQLGCRESGRELPTWSPNDHDNRSQPAPGQVDTKAPRPGMPNLEKQGVTDVVLATWKQSCVPCHGRIGRGDGPQAVAFHPPDFSNARWQEVALDSEMERAIQRGKGPMPSFAHLPADTVRGLIKLVRLMGARAQPAPEPGAEVAKEETPGNPTPTPANTQESSSEARSK